MSTVYPQPDRDNCHPCASRSPRSTRTRCSLDCARRPEDTTTNRPVGGARGCNASGTPWNPLRSASLRAGREAKSPDGCPWRRRVALAALAVQRGASADVELYQGTVWSSSGAGWVRSKVGIWSRSSSGLPNAS